MNKVEILIMSNQLDFTTDYICLELQKRQVNYLRINRDSFSQYRVKFNLQTGELIIKKEKNTYLIDESLQSVYYRAPTYFRETYTNNFTAEEQLYNSQWMSFVRNLLYFENAKWMNNPANTYKAENKLVQLKYAKAVGFCIPDTVVANDRDMLDKEEVVVKTLDTALFRVDGHEAFFYTNIFDAERLKAYDCSLCPIVFQEHLNPKIDYRVTVAGDKIYAAKVLAGGNGVYGDWRKKKDDLKFVDCKIPDSIEKKCCALMKTLDLTFGGIDLIEHKGNFYFVEVNPTGEWGWLVDTAKQNIYEGICDFLMP